MTPEKQTEIFQNLQTKIGEEMKVTLAEAGTDETEKRQCLEAFLSAMVVSTARLFNMMVMVGGQVDYIEYINNVKDAQHDVSISLINSKIGEVNVGKSE